MLFDDYRAAAELESLRHDSATALRHVGTVRESRRARGGFGATAQRWILPVRHALARLGRNHERPAVQATVVSSASVPSPRS